MPAARCGRALCRFAALTIWLSLVAPVAMAGDAAEGPTGPKMQLVQTVKVEDAMRIQSSGINSVQFIGRFLYVSSGNAGVIAYFNRDLQTGRLTYAGELEVGQRLKDAFPKFALAGGWGWMPTKACILGAAGGRLYVVPYSGSGMGWYDIDARTGEPIEKGLVECPPGSSLALGPDQKDLYIRYQQDGHRPGTPRILWYRIQADGRPVRSAEVSGEGIAGLSGGLLQVAPGGRQLYTFNNFDSCAVGRLERKPTGEIAYKDLLQGPKLDGHRQTGSLAISPDGKWLYTADLNNAGENRFFIAKRDPDTGDLTAQETISDGPKGRHLAFLPDSSGGYWGGVGAFGSFKLDAATGRLTVTGTVKELEGQAVMDLVYDRDAGFLYAWSRDSLFVIAAEKIAR